MSKIDYSEIAVSDQVKRVQKCILALQDVYLNSKDDRYSCVLSIISERLESDFEDLIFLLSSNGLLDD
jgi:hypothetical protein